MISLSGIYLKIDHFPVKIGLIWGVGGVPEIRFLLESSSFCYLGAHAKIQNPSCLLSGRKVRESEREKREEKITASTIVTTSAQRRSDQKQSKLPYVAVVPLQTQNNLLVSMGAEWRF